MRGITRIRHTLGAALRPPLRAVGYDIVERHYYSPIPDVRALPASIWDTPSALGGVQLDPDRSLDYIERELTPFLAEFAPPDQPTSDPTQYYLRNGTYASVDGELLYAMVRRHRPARVVELGMGMSSLVIDAAVTRNRKDGCHTEYIAADPYPQTDVLKAISGTASVRRVGVSDIDRTVFSSLEAGDVLFVDTTHTVKIGSDVNFLILDVLPLLAPGVVVHFHDIFLPYQYPREWIERRFYYWAEQYLLQAFLAFNDSFEVLVAAHALARACPQELAQAIPSFGTSVAPGAFWVQRRC